MKTWCIRAYVGWDYIGGMHGSQLYATDTATANNNPCYCVAGGGGGCTFKTHFYNEKK